MGTDNHGRTDSHGETDNHGRTDRDWLRHDSVEALTIGHHCW